MPATLYIVATPIGNLEDVSERCRRVLSESDVIAAEDTRRAGKLLHHLNLGRKELISYYDQVEEAKADRLIQRICEQELSLSLISDAGTPCVADPGYRLVRRAHERGVPVHPIPGPSAMTALISASGLPSDRVLFVGFLPTKTKALQEELQSWSQLEGSVVFFESARRLEKTLAAISSRYPQAEICVGRELTKIYEELHWGSVESILAKFQGDKVLKGELVVMLRRDGQHVGGQMRASQIEERLRSDLRSGMRLKEILRERQHLGLSRSELYQKVLEIKKEMQGE